jgi:hypothetical protein
MCGMKILTWDAPVRYCERDKNRRFHETSYHTDAIIHMQVGLFSFDCGQKEIHRGHSKVLGEVLSIQRLLIGSMEFHYTNEADKIYALQDRALATDYEALPPA